MERVGHRDVDFYLQQIKTACAGEPVMRGCTMYCFSFRQETGISLEPFTVFLRNMTDGNLWYGK